MQHRLLMLTIEIADQTPKGMHMVEYFNDTLQSHRNEKLFQWLSDNNYKGDKLYDFFHGEMNGSLLRFKNYMKEKNISL